MKTLIFSFLFFICLACSAQQPYLVKDINPGSGSSMLGSYYYATIVLNNELFFMADDGTNGYELWKSDGTSAGTVMVKDINPTGSASVITSAYTTSFIRIGNTIYFMATDGVNGTELWKSDGTTAGTVMVKDINPGSGSSATPVFSCMIDLNGTLIFNADDGTNGNELWKSDGTAAGTVMIRNINTSGDAFPNYFIRMNSNIFFSATDATGMALWRTDGTSAGTEFVHTVQLVGGPVSDRRMAVINGTLFFYGANPGNPGTLYKTDGTSAGTGIVKDIWAATSDGCSHFTDMNGTLYYTAIDSVNNEELWKSDGTYAGTVLVKDIYPGNYGSGCTYLVNSNGVLFFSANDSTHMAELWRSDGTEAGTFMVKDISPDNGSYPELITDINGILYFSAYGPDGGELWKSDGTIAGTIMLGDINPGISSSIPSDLVNVNGTLFFSADDTTGRELWSLGLPASVKKPDAPEFKIYPNPSAGETINISVPGAQRLLSVVISDMSGKTLYNDQMESGSGIVSISHNLENGIYLVKISDAATRNPVTRKLVVLR